MPIPEEEELDEDTEGLSSNNPGASLSQNQEQGLSEAQKHSDPIDATIKKSSDEIQNVTESIANMKTEEPNSNITTSDSPSQNKPEQIQSKEQENSAPIVASSTAITPDNSSSNEIGIRTLLY